MVLFSALAPTWWLSALDAIQYTTAAFYQEPRAYQKVRGVFTLALFLYFSSKTKRERD